MTDQKQPRVYQEIGDLEYTYNADIGFAYSSPCRGYWNIVHVGTQVPGCHQIYVCPTSCLRGVVLTTAEMGCMDRMSTITVGEDNILEGDLEETIQAGTEHIIESMPDRPRMVMIFVSCIHQFMAANYQRVYQVLREEYPDIVFVDAYMDPIMRRKRAPLVSMEKQMHRIFRPCDHDPKSVNIIGNWHCDTAHSDLYQHLTSQGITVRDLCREPSFDDFRDEERSQFNVTIHGYAHGTGRDLELRNQMTWIPLRNAWDYEVLDAQTDELCKKICIEPPKNSLREACDQRAAEARKLLGDTPISIDYTAVDEPLGLALYLLEHGFNVESIFVENFVESEEVFRALQKRKPTLRIYSAANWMMRVVNRNHPGMIVGVGQKAAYYNNTPHFIDTILMGGMDGYRAILGFFDLLEEAYRTEKPIRSTIQHKGWRCTAR